MIKKSWHNSKNNYLNCNNKLKIFIFWNWENKMNINISIDYQIL